MYCLRMKATSIHLFSKTALSGLISTSSQKGDNMIDYENEDLGTCIFLFEGVGY